MDRRCFLKSTTAAAGASVVAGAAQSAQGATAAAAPRLGSGLRELRVATAWPEAVAGPADDARRLLSSLVAASDGQWSFRVADAGAEAIDSVARGDADLAIASDNDLTGVDPAFAHFGGLPGRLGLEAAELDAWLIAGGGQLLWDDLAGHHGFKPLLVGHLGAPAGLWSRAPIATVGDFHGASISASGLAADVARGLGARTGASAHDAAIVQGQGLITDLALGRPGGALYYYTHGLMPAGSTISLAVARNLWDGLSGSERAILAGAASGAWRESVAMQKIQARLTLDAMQHGRSVSVGVLPVEIVRQVDRVSEAVVAHAAGSSLRARAIDGSLMAYLHTVGRNLSGQSVA